MRRKDRKRYAVALSVAVLCALSCRSPTSYTPKAPMDGIYNAIAFDDSAPPISLTSDPGLDLRILAATMDLRFQGRAIFTTYMTHTRDPYAPPVTHLFVFAYHLYGDSIATDSGGVGGRRLESSIRFTMKYVVPDSAGTRSEVASHTYLFTR